jgi:serine/threonine protein phosphatase PrpC
MKSDSAILEVGALSETGYVREENQDRMSGIPVSLGALYIVADGMGGHKGGAVAADLAVQELGRHMQQAPAGEPVEQTIRSAFVKANKTVYEKAHSNDPATEGMGTTAVLLLISGQNATLAHVGDSRAYLYRNDKLTRLTTDHTVVQKMVEAGMLKPEEAADHPDSSVLERAIGSKPDVEVDIRKELLNQGDVILLCSDGLCGYVSDTQIESVLRRHKTVKETTADLVQLALEKGGKDNVTVQLIQYGARQEPQAVKQTAPVKPIPNSAPIPQRFRSQSEWTPRRTIAILVLAILVATGAFLLYYRTSQNKGGLGAAKKNVINLEKQREAANATNDKAVKGVEELKGATGREATATTADLRKSLQAASVANEKASKEIRDLKEQLAAASQRTEKLQKDFQSTKLANEKVVKDLNDLKQRLQLSDRELQDARKQIQSVTNANKVGSAQPEITAPKADATTGEKETPKTK